MNPDLALAQLWRAARSSKDERERALEVGLAAALSCPGVWPRIVAWFGWSNVPAADPERIERQHVTDNGRTDLRLRFAQGPTVVLELKHGAPPEPEQMARYAVGGAQVIGIATHPRAYGLEGVLETVSWSRLHALTWPDAPLPWRQLRALLETMGVIVPDVDVKTLTGLFAAWESYELLAGWTRTAAHTCVAELGTPTAPWSCKKGRKRTTYNTSTTHRRFVTSLWPVGWYGAPWARVLVGFYFGRPGDPVLAAGLPDLLLTWHADPASPLHARLHQDPATVRSLQAWRARSPDGVSREVRAGHGQWESIRARSSSALLLGVSDPHAVFQDWVRARLDEWSADGVCEGIQQALADLAVPVDASPGPDEAEDSGEEADLALAPVAQD